MSRALILVRHRRVTHGSAGSARLGGADGRVVVAQVAGVLGCRDSPNPAPHTSRESRRTAARVETRRQGVPVRRIRRPIRIVATRDEASRVSLRLVHVEELGGDGRICAHVRVAAVGGRDSVGPAHETVEDPVVRRDRLARAALFDVLGDRVALGRGVPTDRITRNRCVDEEARCAGRVGQVAHTVGSALRDVLHLHAARDERVDVRHGRGARCEVELRCP